MKDWVFNFRFWMIRKLAGKSTVGINLMVKEGILMYKSDGYMFHKLTLDHSALMPGYGAVKEMLDDATIINKEESNGR